MKLTNIFPVQIFAHKLEDVDAISEYCEDKLQANPQITDMLTDFGTERDYEFCPALRDQIKDYVGAYGRYLCPDFQGMLLDHWLQKYEPGHYHGAHLHSGAVVSMAYYVETDNPADITFYNPNAAQASMNVETSTFSITPEKGLLLLFPSYLLHEVKRQEEGGRLMISANFK